MKNVFNVLLFGGCLLHQPIQRSPRARAKLAFHKYGPLTGVHSFGEMFQVIDVLRGEKEVPLELRPLCRMSPGLRAVPRAKDFNDLDLALVEPASPIEITFRNVIINRNAVMQHPSSDDLRV
jgi:hypothetical protein